MMFLRLKDKLEGLKENRPGAVIFRQRAGWRTPFGLVFTGCRPLTGALLLLLCYPAVARSQNAESGSPTLRGQEERESKPPALGTPEDEMRARNSIKLDEQNHRENLKRVHEATRLASALREVYTQRRSLGRAEVKQLERLEKLIRKVRSEAGGEDAAAELEKYPASPGESLSLLAEMTDALCEKVENTPRQVLSADVVICANEIIQVLKQLRQQVDP